MRAIGKLAVLVSLILPSLALAVDTPELPMKIYGTATGSGTIEAYVGEEALASTPVVDGLVGHAPNIFLIPGTVPEGTTVVLKANNKELQRFAFEHGGSKEVSLTIPALQSSVAAAAMIIVDEAVSGISTLAQTSLSFVSGGIESLAENTVSALDQVVVGALSLFSPGEGGAPAELVTTNPEGEREGFVTYTGEERPQNSLLAAAGAAIPNEAWPWIGGIIGLLGIGGLAFVRFRG